MIKSYYNFFDKKIKHWTSVIFIISVLIIFVWLLFSSKNAVSYWKISIFESKNKILNSTQIIQTDNIITISGIQYKIVLEKLD